MNNYKKSLNLPKTKFSMKANLINKEIKILEKWEKKNQYEKNQNIENKKLKFIIHDGPPYANGKIHLGHAVNKILKDIILKYKRMSGFYAPFIPCWDCHGLPIEHQIEKKNKKKINDLSIKKFREICCKYVEKQIFQQKKDFIRLGILAEWSKPNLTMSYENEANTILTLSKIFKEKKIYRTLKPIYWCYECQSALAEAEIEYQNKEAVTIFLNFEIVNNQDFYSRINISDTKNINFNKKIFFVIYTTTPWTLPTCQAIAINSTFNYQLIEISNQYYIFEKSLFLKIIKKIKIKKWNIITTIPPKNMEFIKTKNPLCEEEKLPVIFSSYVTQEIGTGIVQMAPDHGEEDYIACKKYDIKPKNMIDKFGKFKIKKYKKIYKKNIFLCNSIILKKLQNNKKIFFLEKILHSYPHCWRHKKPIFFRATPQWFIKIPCKKKYKIFKELKKVSWFPHWGYKKMKNMIKNRPDWCISRQRKWGVPIPILIHKKYETIHPDTISIMEKISKKIKKFGSQIWWDLTIEEILGKKDKNYKKVTDILDVWFESGANHQLKIYQEKKYKNKKNIANLYLEGSDQHRGWFMSSFIISMIIQKCSPYKSIITHGFVVDKYGKKMSKSIGNSINPQDIIKKWGADILRLWVAYVDYSKDISISEKVLQHITEHYRKIRNSIRFLLANLYDFDPKIHLINLNNLIHIDSWILKKTAKLQNKIMNDYESNNFHDLIKKILHFCSINLGSQYFEAIKDRQYTVTYNCDTRRSSQTALYHILHTLVRWITPILSFTSYEIWKYIPNSKEKNIFKNTWYTKIYKIKNNKNNSIIFWKKIFSIKNQINKKIEQKKNKKIINSSLETSVILYIDNDLIKLLSEIYQELKFLFSVSKVSLRKNPLTNNKNNFNDSLKKIKIKIIKNNNKKCQRCWFHVEKLISIKEYKNICIRCKNNILGIGEIRKFI